MRLMDSLLFLSMVSIASTIVFISSSEIRKVNFNEVELSRWESLAVSENVTVLDGIPGCEKCNLSVNCDGKIPDGSWDRMLKVTAPPGMCIVALSVKS